MATKLEFVTRKDQNGAKAPPEGKQRVFISHRRNDSPGYLEAIAELLLEYADCAIWYDIEGLFGGVNYDDEIQKAIRSADAMLLLISPTVFDSEYIWDKEIPAAQELGIPIIPIIIQNEDEEDEDVEDKVCTRLKGSIHCLRYHSEDFRKKFLQSVENYIINAEEEDQIRQLFAKGLHHNPAALSLSQVLLMAKGYRRGTGTECDLEKAEKWLRYIAELNTEIFGEGAKTGIIGSLLELMALYKNRARGGEDTLSAFVDCATKAVELGCAEAAIEASKLYYFGGKYSGKRLQNDYKTAYKWSLRAAELGDPSAMYFLWTQFVHNTPYFSLDTESALHWLTKAAECGHADAMYRLGKCYHYGKYLPIDGSKAVEWYKKAVTAGNTTAYFRLAVIYRNGLSGVKGDLVEAIRWYQLASENGNTSAMITLGNFYREGAETLPTDGIKAQAWLLGPAEAGNGHAMYSLGKLYRKGAPGVGRDLEAARYWLEKAAQRNISGARQELDEVDREFAALHTATQGDAEALSAAADDAAAPPAKRRSLARLFILIGLLAIAAGVFFILSGTGLVLLGGM